MLRDCRFFFFFFFASLLIVLDILDIARFKVDQRNAFKTRNRYILCKRMTDYSKLDPDQTVRRPFVDVLTSRLVIKRVFTSDICELYIAKISVCMCVCACERVCAFNCVPVYFVW